MAKISIITINYNNREGLQKTIESVASQTNKTFEYIVVDGGSTDGSAEIIKDNCHFIDKWVSEPDKGIYNAMNKGVQMSSGEYCLFLNSGDLLHDNNVFERLTKHTFDKDIYFGEIVATNGGKAKKRGKYSLNEEITLLTIYEGYFHHAGSFIKRDLMIKYPYREDLKICSDRQFFIQSIIIDNCSYGSIKTPICLFDMGGVSRTSDILLNQENNQIMTDLFPERVFKDYQRTNLQLQNLTKELVVYRSQMVKTICNIDYFLIKIYKLLKKISGRV